MFTSYRLIIFIILFVCSDSLLLSLDKHFVCKKRKSEDLFKVLYVVEEMQIQSLLAGIRRWTCGRIINVCKAALNKLSNANNSSFSVVSEDAKQIEDIARNEKVYSLITY